MSDLVGVIPQGSWKKWLAEGDLAGSPSTGQEYAWYTRSPLGRFINPGDRLYLIAFYRLRGYAPVTRVLRMRGGWYGICREGRAVACTVNIEIPRFRGLRYRWWEREQEVPFPEWDYLGIPI